jgi:hypothetical protein
VAVRRRGSRVKTRLSNAHGSRIVEGLGRIEMQMHQTARDTAG